jgi:hypothetical protein
MVVVSMVKSAQRKVNTAEKLQPKNVEKPIKRWGDGNNILCLVVLLGGKGVRVSKPFINAFQQKKAWNLPKSSTNLGDFKTCFFPPQNVVISKSFFFPS